MTIRPIEVLDLEAMKELLVRLSHLDPERQAEKWLGGWPRETDRGVVAVDRDGEVIGACWFRLFDGPGTVPELIVLVQPEHQSHGVGRSLLEAIIDIAKNLRHVGLLAVINPDNWRVKRLLEHVGFKPKASPHAAPHYLLTFDPNTSTSATLKPAR